MTRNTHYCTECGQVLRRAAPAHPDRGGTGSGLCGDCRFERIRERYQE